VRGFRPERLLPLACLGGAVLLIASQFMDIFVLNDAGGNPFELISSADQHWYAMGVLGVFAGLATLGAVASGSKPLAVAVAAAGASALLLFLLIDLPDAGKAGNVSDPIQTFVTAEADPKGGFWIELIGALILTVCGGALATLTSAQLRDLRPRFGARRERAKPDRRGRPSTLGGRAAQAEKSDAASAKPGSDSVRAREASRSREAG
jgi:MFS family permease